MDALRSATAFVGCLLLGGCAGQTATFPLLARAAAARNRAPTTPPPNLRIPADALASSQEIPLVPVPPVPLGHGVPVPPAPTKLPDPQPAVVRASADAGSVGNPAAGADVQPRTLTLRQVQQQAAAWYSGVDSYIVRMTRREVVGGATKPEEVMMLSFRKEPWSLHFKWVGKVGQGREVILVKGQYENKIQTRLAAGDMPLTPAGMRMSFAVDSPLVRSASRHSITDAGLGAAIERLGANLDAQERGDRSHGVLTDLGPQKRPEFPVAVQAAEMSIPPGAETELPNGGRRLYFFDPDHHLPMLVLTYDDKNQEVEYYHYDRLIAPAGLDGDDFNPDKLWSSPKAAAKGQ